jgi:hypothetical protein
MPLERSKARQGLDKLLDEYPDYEVAAVWHQKAEIEQAERRLRNIEAKLLHKPPDIFNRDGPWLCVDLWKDGDGMRFAIWIETGNVYILDSLGAVEDEPFITIT